MPAPQASMMQQLARVKFMSFALKVPTNWQTPSGDPAGSQYNQSKDGPGAPGAPPLFQPSTMTKNSTDVQKMHVDKIGTYMDGVCSAICSAWSNWQSMATMAGIMIMGPVATMGTLIGPPLMPLILASAPMSTPMEILYSTTIATVIGTGWLSFQSTVMVPGLPWYPLFAAVPSPVGPPTPNIPCPFATLTQVPVSISADTLKGQMVGQLGKPDAPFNSQLFEAISTAFEQCYDLWKVSTMVTNVLGTGPVPTFAPPYVPVGPVMGGVGTMAPGGLV